MSDPSKQRMPTSDFKPKIIVVEDDPAMLRLLGELLKEMGAEPHLFGHGLAAANLIDREKFDGAILDWQLPEMDGLELTRHIRRSKSNNNIPIVMLGGAADQPGVEAFFKAGVSFYLQKPVNVTQLRRLLTASRGAMVAERRAYQRAPVSLTLRVHWEGQQASGLTANLGSRGALLGLEDPPAEGSPVKVEFSLPTTAEALEFTGVVSRVEEDPPPGPSSGQAVAIEFTAASLHHRHQVIDFVDKTLAAQEAEK